ncbi:hypothetical protein BKA62DRAFT_690376 [Auriculariales sp. MPI-PUGE-AT-0066]|nr:hypothetical protein BKA62DRAFT_690376 [Auriculariales sp. MPI-PUGE-AT-0066]
MRGEGALTPRYRTAHIYPKTCGTVAQSSGAGGRASQRRRHSKSDGTDLKAPKFTVQDESSFGDDAPPAYARKDPMTSAKRHKHATSLDTSQLLSPDHLAPAGQGLRRTVSNSSRGSQQGSSRGHRRSASTNNKYQPQSRHIAQRPDGTSLNLSALGEDLRFLHSALAVHTPSPSESPRSRSPPLPPPPVPSKVTGATLDALRLDGRGSVATSPRSTAAGKRREDPLVALKKHRIVILMAGERWSEASAALSSVVDAAMQYEVPGIELHFLNDEHTAVVRSSADIARVFRRVLPAGASSPVGEKIEEILLGYMAELEGASTRASGAGDKVKPLNLLVVTDGVPTDDPESVIVSIARRLDAGHFPLSQVGLQFVQLGDDDEATAALQQLDDGLGQYGVRDMVDMTPCRGPLTGEMLVKVLLGAINRRVDRQTRS